MKRFKLWFVLPMLVLFPVLGHGQVSMDQLRFSKGQDGLWNLDWSGLAVRTYFVQWSTNLVNWQYAPAIEFGLGSKQTRFDTTGRNQFFVRVVGVDDASITTLQQAQDADFDADELSNAFELMISGLDPRHQDSNGNGTLDKDELGMDDDLSHGFEQALGSDPQKSYEEGTILTSSPLQLFLPNE
jgi:hypothetical protein